MICRGSSNREFWGKKEDQPFESSWLASAGLKFKIDRDRKTLSWPIGKETVVSIH